MEELDTIDARTNPNGLKYSEMSYSNAVEWAKSTIELMKSERREDGPNSEFSEALKDLKVAVGKYDTTADDEKNYLEMSFKESAQRMYDAIQDDLYKN